MRPKALRTGLMLSAPWSSNERPLMTVAASTRQASPSKHSPWLPLESLNVERSMTVMALSPVLGLGELDGARLRLPLGRRDRDERAVLALDGQVGGRGLDRRAARRRVLAAQDLELLRVSGDALGGGHGLVAGRRVDLREDDVQARAATSSAAASASLGAAAARSSTLIAAAAASNCGRSSAA